MFGFVSDLFYVNGCVGGWLLVAVLVVWFVGCFLICCLCCLIVMGV